MKTTLISLLVLLAFTGRARAQIGQYDINLVATVWDPNDNNSGSCKNDFHIYFYYPGTGWKDVWWVNSGLGTVSTTNLTTVKVDANNLPTAMYATGSRNWKRTVGGCNGYDDGVGSSVSLPTSPCTSQTYSDIIPNWGSTITVAIAPVSATIQASSTFLPDADKIQLSATPGFAPSVYTWQYSTDGTTWNDFPAAYQGLSTISLSGDDLYGTGFTAAVNTFIRLSMGCRGPYVGTPFQTALAHLFPPYSNTLTFSNRLSSPHISSVTAYPNRCYGENNGYITLQFDRALLSGETLSILATNTATGISAPSQSNVTLTPAPDNSFTWPQELGAGNYTITLIGTYPNSSVTTYTDGSGQTASVSIVSPPAFNYTAVKQNDVHCYGGSDGSIGISASGGVGSYRLGYQAPGQSSYTWIPFDATNPAAGQTSMDHLSPGDYLIRTTDGNYCIQKDGSQNEIITTIPINQPSSPVQLDFSQLTNPLSYGSTDGQITAVLKGGTPNTNGSYGITWTDAGGNGVSTVVNTPLSGSYQTQLQNGGNGTYTLQAVDANFALAAAGQQQGCMLTETFTLVQPPPLVVSIEQTRRVTCHGNATAQLVAHGNGGIEVPNARYSYQWYQTLAGQGSPTPIGQNDSVLSQLPAGDYQVKITDKNGISKTSDPFTIAEPDSLKVMTTTTSLACNADSTGIATAIVSGGTNPFSYNWSTGDTMAVIGGLTEGGYFVFVTDSNGCQAQQMASITAPLGLKIDSVLQSPTCYQRCDGTIALDVTGGAGGYTYSWNTGASAATINNLCAGDYSVHISDQNGCAVTKKFILPDPPVLAVNAGQNTTLCNGQVYSADATISDPAASYQWGSNKGFSSNTALVNLKDTGNYWVTVTDSRGCVGKDSFTLHSINQEIGADFIISTQVFQGQQVSVVNLSQPDPDSINWMIPDTSAIQVLSMDQSSASLQFADTGSYMIGLKAYAGPCWKLATQKVIVLQAQAFDDPGTVSDPLVQTFTVTPNPSSGEFTVHIVLSDPAKIRLRLISVLTDATVDDRQTSGSNRYDLPYHMSNVAKGEYFLLLETAKGNSVYKLMIL